MKTTIAAERARIGLTQSELARKVFSSRENISLIERGLTNPSTNLCVRIAEFFKLPVQDFLEFTNKTKDENRNVG